MNTRKNLTVAVLAALLSVPAFGVTNNAHAAYRTEDQYYSNFNRLIPGMKPGSVVNHDFYKNGHEFNVYTVGQQEANGGHGDLDPVVTGIDGNNNVSNAQVEAALKGASIGSASGQNDDTNTDNSSSDSSESNNNTQYTSQSGQLPQTNENDGVSKAAVIGDIALATGASLAALGFAEKHRDLAKEDVAADNMSIDSDDSDKGHNKTNYSNKSSYDMIMNNTFAKLSKNLRDM